MRLVGRLHDWLGIVRLPNQGGGRGPVPVNLIGVGVVSGCGGVVLVTAGRGAVPPTPLVRFVLPTPTKEQGEGGVT